MKYIVTIILSLSLTYAHAQDYKTNIGIGMGMVILGGVIHSSPLFEGNYDTPRANRYTSRLGMGCALIGTIFVLTGVFQTRKLQFTGTGVRLWL